MDWEGKRIDLHTHTTISDGVLLPSELLRRATVLGYGAVAITDHADSSNLEEVLRALLRLAVEQGGDYPLVFLPGVELTHVAPPSIPRLAHRARELGAAVVVVHGETPAEPVAPGTNRAAVTCPNVDVLAHPGLISIEEARLAAENGVYLEITSRQGHCLGNGHVAALARATGAKIIVNTDTHRPSDMMSQNQIRTVAEGAGLSSEEITAALVTNPSELIVSACARLNETRVKIK
ncbi:MAG: histidinol phosphate phosphatase domain-containing protein [Chloroflexi bacterium]|nr:histidinol phosphate phosphatase domain-containing protein [Chloroflexota bacterium]